MSRNSYVLPLASVLAALCLLLTSSGCGPSPEAWCQKCDTTTQAMLPCDPEMGCPGEEQEPPLSETAMVSLTFINSGPVCQPFNAYWQTASRYTTLLSGALLAPDTAAVFPNAIQIIAGTAVRVGASVGVANDYAAWTWGQWDLQTAADQTSCTVRYVVEGNTPRLLMSCAGPTTIN